MNEYSYMLIKQQLFTDDGQRMFLRVRDFVHKTLGIAGAVRMDKAMDAAGGGDCWLMMACVDRLVELNEIVEVTGKACPGQHRIFVAM